MEKTIRTPDKILEDMNLSEQVQILHEIKAIAETGIIGNKFKEAAQKIEAEIGRGDFSLWFDTIVKEIPLILALKFAPKPDCNGSSLFCKDKQYISKTGEIVKPLFIGEMNVNSEGKNVYGFTECVVFEHLWGSHHVLSSADFFAKYELHL